MKFILNNEQKLLLIVLDEYYHLVGICKENDITWINYREQIWEKLLKNNGFRQKILPDLWETIRFSQKIKGNREKNPTFYAPIPATTKTLSNLQRDIRRIRHEKSGEFVQILEGSKSKTIHRFYTRIAPRYKNLKQRRMA
jgi:hypothetical protein|tara:strand:+ start:2699 stop:3118 length:420 start_codon:yes stop_codon:yes gene_type:complete